MVKLVNEDIKTREVLELEGLHVFHFLFFIVFAEVAYIPRS